MGSTLSKGYKLPATGDRDWWDQLSFDITRLNGHTHDGVNSEAISPKNLNKSTQTIDAANWAAVSGEAGTFSQTVVVPSGYSVDNMQVKFLIDGGSEDGHEVFPSVRKVSSTSYEVFINDDTVDLTAVYG